nr:immunoglobulin light chain junction region [Macaca mulatta]
CQQNYEIPFTF